MKKEDSLNQSNKALNFWLCAGLLTVLLASIMARDISRPFYGLHSWKEAAAAWRARCYLKYDLEYTKGLAVWAVGDPPGKNPNRSLDHPQLGLFLPALDCHFSYHRLFRSSRVVDAGQFIGHLVLSCDNRFYQEWTGT